MTSGRSFTAYVKDKFYNDIYPAVEEYVEQNWKGLDLRLRNVHTVGGAAMSDMEIKFETQKNRPLVFLNYEYAYNNSL